MMTKDEFLTLAGALVNERVKNEDITEYIFKLATSDDEIDYTMLAKIYAKYLPKPTKTNAKNDVWNWVALSTNSKETNTYKERIYFDGENLVATTGVTLHLVYDFIGVSKVGYYDPKTKGYIHNVNIQYPDYKKLINNIDLTNYNKCNHVKIEHTYNSTKTKTIKLISPCGENVVEVNADYYYNLISGLDVGYSIYLPNDTTKPVVFIQNNQYALLMPVRDYMEK